jgi:hypothetical protein
MTKGSEAINYELFDGASPVQGVAGKAERQPKRRMERIIAFPTELARNVPRETAEEGRLRDELRRVREELVVERQSLFREAGQKGVRETMEGASVTPTAVEVTPERTQASVETTVNRGDPPAPERTQVRAEPQADARAAVLPIPALAALVAIGVGCMLMSIINTNAFLRASGKSAGIALGTAALIAGFAALAFYAGAVGVRTRRYAAALCFPLAGVIIGFSVFSTIAVSYEQMQARATASVEAVEYAEQTVALLAVNTEDKVAASADADRLAAGLQGLRETAAYWRDKSWAKYDAAQARIDELETRLTAAQTRLAGLRAEERTLHERGVAAAQMRVQSVYTFLAGVLGVPAAFIQFVIFCIPAVFFDVASPLLLGLALAFTRRRR